METQQAFGSHILVTGGDGMLAWDLSQVFEKASIPVRALNRKELDITSESSLQAVMASLRPKWVLNAAAYTNVDGAETERDLAEAINGRGPALLAKVCKEMGAKLVHFSTDQVFDGKKERPRTEEESPTPSNYYAVTKLHGEDAVLRETGALVLRVQWLYGQRKDRFSPLRQKKIFTPFSDQKGSPTWGRKVAETTLQLLKKDSSGLFHFSYDDYASWAEVFQFVKEEWDLETTLEPKATKEVALPANRPLFSVLSNEKLKRELGVSSMGSWKTPLREFLLLRGGE